MFLFPASACPRVYYRKGDKAPDRRKLDAALALPPWWLLSKKSLGNRAAVPEEGAGWEGPHSPNTGPWRSPCVSRTAALVGGLSWAGDLGNCVVSRVPATLAMCPCHSPETPSGPCSPVSVPVQAPPPWGRLAPCMHLFWVRRHPLGCPRATGTLGSPQSFPLCSPPTPVLGASSGLAPPRGPAGVSSFSSCP